MATRDEIEDMRVRNAADLALLARKLGYKSQFGQLQFTNGAFASDLFEFLDDNPGVMEAIVDWVLDNFPLVEELEP